MLNNHAYLLIVYYKVTIGKLQFQNTAFNELPYLLNHNRQREKKNDDYTICICVKNDEIVHRRLSL